MSLFDLLFVALVLTGLCGLCAAAVAALLGRREGAVRILRRLALGGVLYVGVVLVVSLVVPRQELRTGEPLCFDDWCITVEGVQRTDSPTEVTYVVALRLSSRARGVTQREVGLDLYLVDATGRRHGPVADASDVPLDTSLAPGDSVAATRTFRIPPGARVSGLVVAHGGFPIRWFLIGEGPFRAAPIVIFEGSE
jgi:hypothetical protein